MCKGLQDWMLAEKAEGKLEGKIEGKIEGKLEGKIEGIIKTARKFHISEQQLLEHLMQELHIDEAKAQAYILQVE